MKAIIDGKRYDTESAELVATHWKGDSRTDFNFVHEELYKTKKENWFLAGEGGPLSEYAESCGNNSTCGGESITPLSPKQVKEFLEEWNNVEALEKHFADEIEDA